MADLFVWTFDTETGAASACDELAGLQEERLLELEDAAVVIRRPDGKVKVKQAADLVGAGALGGTFWGMLIGVLFLAPWMGAAIGAMPCPPPGKMQDYGIDDEFIKRVGNQIEPGHSAVFMLMQSWTEARVLERLRRLGGQIIYTSLSEKDEANLKAAFGAED